MKTVVEVVLLVTCCVWETHTTTTTTVLLTTPPSLPKTTTAPYISPCNYFAQNQVLRCVAPLVEFVNPKKPSITFHPALHNMKAECERWNEFQACTAEVPAACTETVAGHITRLYHTICDNMQMHGNISAEKQCYLKMAGDVKLTKCELNMTKEIDNEMQNTIDTSIDNSHVDCRVMQEYLNCLTTSDYLRTCEKMLYTELRVLQSISSQCRLEIIAPISDHIKPLCNDKGFCRCSDGYTYDVATRKCKDEDECLLNNTMCSQKCINTAGSYECKCDERYYMQSNDSRECIRKDTSAPSIFFAHGQSVWNISDDGQDFQLLRAGLKKTAMIDIDIREKVLYYADIGSNKLERLKIKGGFPRNLQTFEVDGVEGIAVDWVARNLYHLRKDAVLVQQLDGRFRKTLYTDVMKLPRALVVHPASGYMYVTEWSASAFVGRAAMDGSSFEKIITDGVVWPNGLAIDHFADRLYWGDAFLDTIESADMDGRNRRTVIAENGNVPHIFGMAIFEDYIYWTDWTYRGILRADKRTGKNITVLAQTALLPYGIKIYHSTLQPESPNPCATMGCSQLCLLTPAAISLTNADAADNGTLLTPPPLTGSCACSDGFRLETDGKTCTSNCTAKQLLCGGSDPRCVSRVYQCDGIGQCKDHSDEKDCPPRICLPGQFQCHNNKKCLLPGNVCDGTPQCVDQSDEAFC